LEANILGVIRIFHVPEEIFYFKILPEKLKGFKNHLSILGVGGDVGNAANEKGK